MDIKGQRILISPNSKASQRTKNRIRQHGKNGFRVLRQNTAVGGVCEGKQCWLLKSSKGWCGWLPKEEFHLEAWGEEFFVEKF